jgi:hypothetical protein
MQKRKLILRWQHISIGKAFRVWRQKLRHNTMVLDLIEERESHLELHLKRQVFSVWHRLLLKKRAGAISLGRWLKRTLAAALRRRLKTWHDKTVQHSRRKVMACSSLLKLSRVHALRHAMSEIRRAAFEHFSRGAASVLTQMHDQAKEELIAKHREEKNSIFHAR